MEYLLRRAAETSLTEEEGEAAVGGFLSVLKKSKNVSKEEFGEILNKLDGAEVILKRYERGEFRKKMPNPATMLLPRPDFAPPGPPPPIVVKNVYTGVRKAIRKDKDAGNTQDMMAALEKDYGIEEAKTLAFLPVFIAYVKKKAGIDVSDVLRVPMDDETLAGDGAQEETVKVDAKDVSK